MAISGEAMKKAALFLGIGFIGFVVILFGAVMIMTNPLVNVAEEYFSLISQDRIDKAYELTSRDVRAAFTIDDFEEINNDTLLKFYYDASWYSRSWEGDRGELEGIIKTTDAVHNEVDVMVQLVKENGEWKIYSLDLR